MRQAGRILIAILIALLLTVSAIAEKVKVDHDDDATFSSFRTYVWQGCEGQQSPLFTAVREAVTQQLTEKGLTESARDPDLYVTCLAERPNETELGRWGPEIGWYGPIWYGWGPRWVGVTDYNYTKEQLIVDLVDARNKAVAWRAYCERVVNDPSRVHKAVRKAFREYPPRASR